MDAKISVIVPVYNAEKTLKRCVDALLKQTYQNIEIILVDDGSKDRSLEICQQYAEQDNRVKVIHKPNGGVSSARNAGLDVADGEFIMFCDSDDWAEPEWCEELISHYEPGCLVMCQYYVEQAPETLELDGLKVNTVTRFAQSDFYNLKMDGVFVPWNKIYLRAVVEENALRFDEKLTNGEDMLFNAEYLRCILDGIIFYPKKLIHYIWPRETSLSNIVPNDYFEQLLLLHGKLKQAFFLLRISQKSQWTKIYTDFYNEYQKGLLALMQEKQLRLSQKIKKANAVMKSEDYQSCSHEAIISSNKFYDRICRAKNCYGFLIWNYIAGRKA